MKVLILFFSFLLASSDLDCPPGSDCDLQWDRFTADTDSSTPDGKVLEDAMAADSDLVDAWKKLDDAGVDDAVRKDINWLKRVNDWEGDGVSVAPDAGQNTLKLFEENGGSKVAEVTHLTLVCNEGVRVTALDLHLLLVITPVPCSPSYMNQHLVVWTFTI